MLIVTLQRSNGYRSIHSICVSCTCCSITVFMPLFHQECGSWVRKVYVFV